jgi:hypothetical protein
MNEDIDMLSYKAESAGMKVINMNILNRARRNTFEVTPLEMQPLRYNMYRKLRR